MIDGRRFTFTALVQHEAGWLVRASVTASLQEDDSCPGPVQTWALIEAAVALENVMDEDADDCPIVIAEGLDLMPFITKRVLGDLSDKAMQEWWEIDQTGRMEAAEARMER